jgi:hypothetical protein
MRARTIAWLWRQGREGKVELLTGIEGASSRPVRKIVLRSPTDG